MVPEIFDLDGESPVELSTQGSVGEGGQNRQDDVRLVQTLLNLAPSTAGGASPALAVDGLVGPRTIGAIRRYQQGNLGFADGRVDARNKTIRHLLGTVNAQGSLPSMPGLSGATPRDVTAFKSMFGQFPSVAASAPAAVSGSNVRSLNNTGFGKPFTSSGWTINNNAASIDITVNDKGVYLARLEIFQEADPTQRAKLGIAGVFKSVSPKGGPTFGLDIALPSFTSTQGKILRGLFGAIPIFDTSFIGLCQFAFVGGNIQVPGVTFGASLNLFQFAWTPIPVPGACVGFAAMAGVQKGIPGVAVGGGTGICSVI